MSLALAGPVPGVLVRRPWLLPIAATVTAWSAHAALRSSAPVGGHLHHAGLAVTMAVAMMGPLAVPLAAAAARTVEWRRAEAAVVAATATFAMTWALAGVALHVAGEAIVRGVGSTEAAVGLAVASALVVASPGRRERLAACASWRPVFPAAPLAGVVDASAAWTVRCLRTCWAPMALTAVDQRPATVVAASVAVVLERVVPPRRARLLGLVYVAVVAAVVASWVTP